MVRSLPANAGDIRDSGLIPGLGRSPGEGRGNPLQYSCLENPMDRGAWGGLQSTQGCAELDTTEQLSTQHHFKCNCCSLSLPWQGVVQAPWKVQSTGAGLGIREE